MSYVQGPAPTNGPEGVVPRLNKAEEPKNVKQSGDPKDSVQISELARWKARLAELPGIREDLVSEIRDKIEGGVYESEEKIRATAEKLLSELEEGEAV